MVPSFLYLFLQNLPFLSVVMGLSSSFLWFNSISFQEDSIAGDDFNTQVILASISLVNLFNGLFNLNYISNRQINCLTKLGFSLVLLTGSLEIFDYLKYNINDEDFSDSKFCKMINE